MMLNFEHATIPSAPTAEASVSNADSDKKQSQSHRSGVKTKSAPKQHSEGKARQQSAAKSSNKSASKQDRVVAMLQRKDSASIAAITKVTGWQQHSVRGFFAGVVRKKLRLNLTSEEVSGKRIYRIAPGKPAARKRSRRL